MDVRQDLTAFRQESHQVRIISQQQIDVLTRQLREVQQKTTDLRQILQDTSVATRTLQQALHAQEQLLEDIQSAQKEFANNIKDLFHKVYLLFQRSLQHSELHLAATQDLTESPSRQPIDLE